MNSPLTSPVVFHLGFVPVTLQVLVGSAIVALLGSCAALLSRRLRPENPGRAQILAELFVDLVQSQVRETTAVQQGACTRFVATLFLFVLCANLASLLPGVEAPTAHIETDLALALCVLAAEIALGVRAGGWRGVAHHLVEPNWLLLPLNLIEHFTRTFSMTLRLFGNVMSGAFVVGIVLSLAGLLVPVPFMALDALTSVIQAYIFAALALVFIGTGLAAPAHPDVPEASHP